MGEPIRLRTPSLSLPSLSLTDTSSRPGFKQRMMDNRTRKTTTTSTSHLAKAFQRQETLRSFGVPTIGEEDIERVISDPDQLKKIKRLLSDREIEDIFGIYDPDDKSAFRQESSITAYARARLIEAVKEDGEGTKELDSTKQSRNFWDAIKFAGEFFLGEDDEDTGQVASGFKQAAIGQMPIIGAIKSFFTAQEATTEILRRSQVRADLYSQAHGGADMIELNRLNQDKGYLQRIGEYFAPPGSPLGLLAGVDETGMPQDLNWFQQWKATNIAIPFLDTNWLAAGVANDLAEMGFGTQEERNRYKRERDRLYRETGDWMTASLTAFRAREDLSTLIKEGIILGSDPTIVWGGLLGAGKMAFGGVKAARGIGQGLTRLSEFRRLDIEDMLAFKKATREDIVKGIKGKFWGEGDEAWDSDKLGATARRVALKEPELLEQQEKLDATRFGAGPEETRHLTMSELQKELDAVGGRNRRRRLEQEEMAPEQELDLQAKHIDEAGEVTEADIAAIDDILQQIDEPSIGGVGLERGKFGVNIMEEMPDETDMAAHWVRGKAHQIRRAQENDVLLEQNYTRQLSEYREAEKAFITSREEFIEQAKSDLLGGGDEAQQSRFWRDNADILEELAETHTAGREWSIMRVGNSTSSEDILSRVQPRTTIGGRGRGGILRRLLDPSSEIHNYEKGSLDRTILEGKVLHGRLSDEGDAFLSSIMEQFRAMGEWFGPVDTKGSTMAGRRKWYGAKRSENRYLFEVGEGKKDPFKDADGNWVVDKDEGRLWGIAPKRGQKGQSLYVSDVFSIGHKKDEAGNILEYGRDRRNKMFVGLTEKQNDAIDMMQDYYQRMLKLAEDEGLELRDLGDFFEGLAFISRRTKGGDELMSVWGKRGTPGFFRSRFYKTMKEGILDGKKYYNPVETAEMYGRAMYRMIADKRLESWLLKNLDEDAIKTTDLKTLRPDVQATYDIRTKQLKTQDTTLRLLGQYIDGKTLTQAEKKSMLSAYPELAEELQKLWKSGRSLDPDKLIRHFKKAVRGASNEEIKEAIKGTRGNARKMMDKNDVEAVLRRLGVDLEKDYDKVEQIVNAGNKATKDSHSAMSRMLQKRMLELLQDTRGHLEEATEYRTSVRERLRDVGPDEAVVPNINATIKGENAKKLAADLDKFLHDQGYPLLNFATNLNDAIRLMKTGFDFGVFLIQGLPILFRDPEIWGNSMGLSIRAFLDDGVRASYIQNNSDDILDFIKHGGHIGSTEMTVSMEKGGWFAKLPMVAADEGTILRKGLHRGAQAIHKTSRRFQSQYDTFLDVARIEMYKAMRPTWANHTTKATDIDDLADFINKTTGHTSTRALGMSTTQRQLEAAFFLFSPKYTRAIASLFLDITKGGLRGQEARKSIAHLMVSQYALHTAISAAMGQEPNYVPGRANWLKTNIPGVGNIGFGGKPNALINMAVDVSRQIGTNPQGFMNWNLWSHDTYEQNSILKRLRYQASPVSTSIINMITDVDPIGRKLPDWQDIYLDDAGNPEFDMPALKAKLLSSGLQYLPFMVEAMHEAGPIGGFAEGVGAQIYPERTYEARDQLLERYARREFGISLDELRSQNDYETKKSILEQKYPDLQDASRRAREDARNFQRNDERIGVRDQRQSAIDRLGGQWKQASTEFQTLGGNHRTFRKRFWDANKVYGEKMRALRKAHPDLYADMNAYYEGKGVSNEVQAATNAFMDRLFSAEAQDWFGNTDYAAIDRIKSNLEDVYGDEVMREVGRNFTLRMKDRAGLKPDPVVLDFIDSIEGLRKYWDVGKELMTETEWRLWLAYDNSSLAVQESLKRSKKDLNFAIIERKIERARIDMQRENQKIDRWLAVYYGKDALHRDNRS